MRNTFEQCADELRAKVAVAEIPASKPATSPHVTEADLVVVDDVLPDPRAYVRAVRGLAFRSVPIGDAIFHGIAPCDDSQLLDLIAEHHPEAQPRISFFRRSPEGQVEPNFLHTDRDMGDWTGILYLTRDPIPGDGTAFWEHRASGARASTAATEADTYAEWATWRESDAWTVWHTVAARFNRLLLFPAPCFHSRAIPANYGDGEDARLIQVVFGTGALR